MADMMRGAYTGLAEIRRMVFREVAKLAYADADDDADYRWVDELPYRIIPGDVATYRESVFLERAVVGERIRLTMGLPLQDVDRPARLSEGVAAAARPETYYQPPLINVIKFACNACEEECYEVTNMCQGCLAHPCREICPTGAVTFVDKKAHIDKDACINCGRCASICPYTAIAHRERPCAAACGMNAIASDEWGRAEIDYDRCVSCGQCLVNCPFGAIADKSQIFQVIQAITTGDEVIAAVAPAFVGQFGGRGNVDKLREAFLRLGFCGMEEVAIGADLCTVQEAEYFVDEVPDKLPFMGTSCCPAWSVMAKREFPEHAQCISMALTPMVLTARLIRERHPDAKIVFVGPCAAKKLEARRTSVKSEVDFVLTFEEMAGMMEAKEIDYRQLSGDGSTDFEVASADGRGFAVAGGVASAVANAIHSLHPEREVRVEGAEGLANCRKMLKAAVKGKYDGCLLEGMACPGGCVAGAGTLQPVTRSAGMVRAYAKRSPYKTADEDRYRSQLSMLERSEDRA
ncbi:hydrogenase large subunit domain protein [Coriobacterium glomerans PW2]|uniref:Hydrogenase large subunit domain protein n=1 Tax=Coriobacterium glomerans (strain ATCC 49209 / DSM 20642 / JCM 10262 / PW2) TaxID=700015 RepID=F2N853_CORGP|nr:4Fe-4S dicluster domain-containing protein [Coriobacterium glomerans]AEB07236.1 hydrogenase large subunit domain protein [Coriobacterium glomerans PW2]